MKAVKTETLTVRVEPAINVGVKAMAEHERRSLANMIEVMIRGYCARHGMAVTEQGKPGRNV